MSYLIDLARSQITQGRAIPILGKGRNTLYTVKVQGREVIYKTTLPSREITQRARRVIRRGFLRTTGQVLSHKGCLRDQIGLETRVLRNWQTAKIDCPEILAEREREILIEYVPGMNANERIAKGKLTLEDQENTVALISKAREEARKRKDPYYLHNDLHPGNIIFDENGEPRLIDPDCSFRTEIPFENLDAYFNLMMAYHLATPYSKLGDPKKARMDWLELFLDSLEEDTKILMLNLNRLGLFERFYATLAPFFKDKCLTGKMINPNTQATIQAALEKRL